MMSALPPRSGESPTRRAGGVSRLAMMQARFQAKQLEEKEEKLIHMLEEKQVPPKQDEIIQRVNYGRDSANSINSLSSTASSNSVNGTTGQRPGMYANPAVGGGRVRQMFEQRRSGGVGGGKVSPIGWDKSYPLEPVEAINPDIGGTIGRTSIYKQNVTRNNSNSSSTKYGGGYGQRGGGPSPVQGMGKRGLSLDRVNRGRASQNGFGYGQTTGLVRAQSQANMTGNSSSEDSFKGSATRPYSGFGFNNASTNPRTRKPSGGSVSGRFSNYEVSPDDSPPMQRRSTYGQTPAPERDYTRPLPPTYRRQGRHGAGGSRTSDPSPSRHSYHDSAYSSHSSHSSDNPAFSVIAPPSRGAPPLSTQSSPSKSYSRQNSFTYDNNPRINSRTFRKQKSPLRNRSPSLSPSRSAENSDETDLPNNDDYANRIASRNAEREREEERRRMQVEMRKREQELLARIKEQQRELDAVKAEKSKVEKQLTRQEKERQVERKQLLERERIFEEEKHQRDIEEKDRREEKERRLQEEQEQIDRQGTDRRERDLRSKPQERALMRDKASPAHLRGRRPPSLSRMRGPSRGPSREPSFDNGDDRDSVSSRGSGIKGKTTAYISRSESNNTVNIEIKNNAKKQVPPSPAIKKKAPAGTARRSVFAPKPRDDLTSCKNCGRNFAEDRIEKHEEICLKTAKKKRKTFDMTKARVKGTDAANYVKSAAQLKAVEAKDQKKNDWRKKREEFINTLKAAKETQRHLANGGSLKDLPPPPPMDTSDYIQCPHCNRRFAEGAAERHIPKCKDIKSNKKH